MSNPRGQKWGGGGESPLSTKYHFPITSPSNITRHLPPPPKNLHPMALQERISRLDEILSVDYPDPELIKRQLKVVTWLPATESTEDLIKKTTLPQTLRNLYLSQNLPPSVNLEAYRIVARWGRGLFGPPVWTGPRRLTGPGPHGFVSGDCWPSREAMFLEGCHGTTQSGIHGDEEYGAFSIVANGVYDNRDTGDSIWYSGTNPTHESEASGYTQRLITSHRTGNPVRVFRGANSTDVLDEDRLAPVRGFRYDGLYRVVQCQVPLRAGFPPPPEGTYEFFLRRNVGQPPIQCSGPDVKPDDETLAMWHQMRLYG